MSHRQTPSFTNFGYRRISGLLAEVRRGRRRLPRCEVDGSPEASPTTGILGCPARGRRFRDRMACESFDLRLSARPAALRRHDQMLERRTEVVPLTRSNGIEHREQRGSFGAAAATRLGDEPGAVFRQTRSAIADEQPFAEPSRGLDVLLPGSGDEVLDGVLVCTRSIALLGPKHVRGRQLQWRRCADQSTTSSNNCAPALKRRQRRAIAARRCAGTRAEQRA